MRICLNLNRRVCFDIPVLVRELKFPPPDPLRGLEEIPRELGRDLQLLATVANLSRELSPDLAKPLNAGLQQAFASAQRQLPAGAELNLDEEAQAAE